MARKATKAAPSRTSDSRWITVHGKFDYTWESGAVTHFSPRDFGDHRVKNELADFAVEKGYATEGKLEEQGAAKAADSGSDDGMAQPDMADADRAAGGQPVDPDAE